MTMSIVILDRETDEIVKAFPVEDLSARERDKLERGITRQMNWERFWMDERDVAAPMHLGTEETDEPQPACAPE